MLRRNRWATLFLVVALALAACGSGATGSGPREEPLKVAWINEGHSEEDPWTAWHARARKAVDEALGDRVETTFVERVALGDEAHKTIDRLVAEGNRLIVATSHDLSEFTEAASRKYPDTYFEQARGEVVLSNLSTYSGAHEEPIYLIGMIAGEMTETGALGFVATVAEPETIRHINAYALGARSVNPSVEVRVAWTNSWWKMDLERGLAEMLIAEGADVIATGATSPATGEAARVAGVAWSSHDADRSETFADVWLTSSIPDWSGYYTERVRAVLEGTWEPHEYYGTMADGFTDLAPLGARVPSQVRRQVMVERDRIIEGDLDVFDGPILDKDGRERVPAGRSMPFAERMSIDWFVDGVVVRIPQGEEIPPG
jgi:basic membrane protein A and related proteins